MNFTKRDINKQYRNGDIVAQSSSTTVSSSTSTSDLKNSYVTIDYFNRLFQAHDSTDSTDVQNILPNDMSSTITDLEFKFGSWTSSFLTALGQGSGSSGTIDLAAVWASLTKEVTDAYASSLISTDHIPIDGTTIVVSNGVLTAAGGGGSGSVTEVDTGDGLTGGPITSTGTISIDTSWMSSHYIPISGSSNISGNLIPTNTWNIGSNRSKWDYVYANYFVGDLTGNADTATSATNATNATNASKISITNNNAKKAYVTGAASTSGNNTLYVDTGVYLTTTAGQLAAKYLYATTGIDSDGYITALASSSSSDERMKDILYTHLLSLDEIADAPCVDFIWKHNGIKSSGSIAQYWQSRLPGLVHQNGNGMLSMEYGTIATMSVISLANEVRTLKDEVKSLKDEISELKAMIMEMKGGKSCQ